MDRDRSPLPAQRTAGPVPALRLDVHRLLDESTRLPGRAEFRFDPALPLVVTVEFLAEGGPGPARRLDRELPTDGLTATSGAEGVRRWPTRCEQRPSSWLLLEPPDTEVLFELPAAPPALWPDAAPRTAPTGSGAARPDWDGLLVELLDGPGVPSE
ncbi:SsgA family sporulation/cell division regulator [Kitasatospora sp. NPDC056327]|uniref:SsgA family sporulation/cell division regulator n=1 Tax=Kitasatospora sp. NPDC056327 TaxID=3345785 RepID=UPI0035D52C21